MQCLESVKSFALVAKKTRKPPKDRTPIVTNHVNGVKSFYNCYLIITTDHLLVYLCPLRRLSFYLFILRDTMTLFAKMLCSCYYLLPAGADPCLLNFSHSVIAQIECVHSKKDDSVYSLQKKCKISNKTCNIEISSRRVHRRKQFNYFSFTNRFGPAKYITWRQCSQPPGCGTNPHSKWAWLSILWSWTICFGNADGARMRIAHTAQKAKYSDPNSCEYGSVDVAYTAVFPRIRSRLTRRTPEISYLNPACFSELKLNTPEWLKVFEKACVWLFVR